MKSGIIHDSSRFSFHFYVRACAHARARTTGRYANGKIFSQIPDGISIPKMYVLYNPQETLVYDIGGGLI